MKIKEEILNEILSLLIDSESWKQEEFVPGKSRVGYTGAVFGIEETSAYIRSFLEGWFGLGKCGEALQKELANYVGVNHALLTNSGSSANLLMIVALKDKSYHKHLNDGDEVIVSANSFSTTVSSLLNQRLVPVYIDTELGTYNPSLKQIEEAISEKTRAILVTHTQGNPNDVDAIKKICEEKNLILLEDNSDSLGSEYKEKKVGSFGLMSALSFYPAHHMTTAGEGGAILTNDVELLKILRAYRDWGRDCWCSGDFLHHLGTCGKRFDWEIQTDNGPVKVDHKHLFSRQGFNLKMTEQQAAFGLEQIKKLNNFSEIRRKNFELLNNGLKRHEEFFILPKNTENSRPCWFSFPVTIKNNAPFTRAEIQKFLAEKNIETRVMFGGNLTAHPGFKNTGRISGKLENANIVLAKTFLLGCYHGLTEEMINYVLSCLDEFLDKYKV